jgi:hypothetical protein
LVHIPGRALHVLLKTSLLLQQLHVRQLQGLLKNSLRGMRKNKRLPLEMFPPPGGKHFYFFDRLNAD